MGFDLVVAGVGGQGVILLARLIAESALLAGKNVTMSEIHGMAQRGGSVITMVRIGAFSSPIIGTGDADLIIGLEPVETLRALDKASKKTVIITSDEKIIPFPVSLGVDSYPDIDVITDYISKKSKKLLTVNSTVLVRKVGSEKVLNTIMLGASAKYLPISERYLKAAIKKVVPKKYLKLNLKAFELGVKAIRS